MGKTTGISWCDSTWNPWRGCVKVSQGCKNCYMFREQTRYGHDPRQIVRAANATFYAPLRWKEPARVFTCSWSDFFLPEADQWRDEAWGIIAQTSHLTYQILTKRPENISSRLPKDWGSGWKNVHLGVSVENQLVADERIGQLLRIPAAIRFLSMEPLLKAIDLGWCDWCGRFGSHDCEGGYLWAKTIEEDQAGIDWVIIGGESGPNARPFDISWADNIIWQCRQAGVPVFMKQLGSNPCFLGNKIPAPKDSKGGNPAEWPEDLRIREFPKPGVGNP